MHKKDDIKLTDKIVTLLEKIKDLIEKFPRENIDDKDILDIASDIRVKYKKVCSLLKIDGGYPYDDSISYWIAIKLKIFNLSILKIIYSSTKLINKKVN